MAEETRRPRLIVGISGASGVIYGARLLELLRPLAVETHLVISRAAEVTLALETNLKPALVRSRADVVHAISDLAAPISSGSFKTIGMVVAPCSIRSMAEIASGVTTTLLSRAADVVLKERRRLVLLAGRAGGDACEGEAGDEEMRAHPAVRNAAQRMRRRLGQRLYP